MEHPIKSKMIGFATLVYSVGFIAIASLGYLIEESIHLVNSKPKPAPR